jgi:hypothetical protein
MKRILQILNVVTLLFTIGVNYFFNGQQGTASISDISAKYDNLLTPAGYAFGIWGLIYIGLIIFAVYQLWDLVNKKTDTSFVTAIGWWFIVANLANAAWVIAFTHDQIGLSVLIMLVLFFSLLKIVLNINMERWDAPVRIIGFIWWPVSLYFGWINVALMINISAYLTSLGWDGSPLNAELWAIIVLLLASVIFISMIWTRNMREYANVGVWGIVAIAVNNWNNAPAVAWVALAVSVVIFVNAGIHGYKNRATAPFTRKDKPI